jgi:hypothetical protein
MQPDSSGIGAWVTLEGDTAQYRKSEAEYGNYPVWAEEKQ